MISIIGHLFSHTTGPVKILSTKDGRVKLDTFEDVKIYAHTQGVFYFAYLPKHQFTEYYIELAELMRRENRNRWATYCYLKALNEAWRDYKSIALSGYRYLKDERECVDPYELYRTIRLYMLETGNSAGLKKLKMLHSVDRNFCNLEYRFDLHREREREWGIERILDKDFFLDRFPLTTRQKQICKR